MRGGGKEFIVVLGSFVLKGLMSLYVGVVGSIIIIKLCCKFLAAFSVKPSCLFLLQTQIVRRKRRKARGGMSTAANFVAKRLVVFVSVCCTPLRLTLNEPRAVAILTLPCLLFRFF